VLKTAQILRCFWGGSPLLDNKEYKWRIENHCFGQWWRGFGWGLTDGKKARSLVIV